jgi:general secretion pathway protein H
MTSRNRQAGFTLIETIVVLVVLGLMVGLVLARGPVRSRSLELRAAADQLAQTLRGARAQAIRLDRPVSFVLDLARHSYSIGGGRAETLPLHMGLSMITVAGETMGSHIGGIVFEPDGSASGGRIEIADGQRRLQVGVDWLTGRVSVADAK